MRTLRILTLVIVLFYPVVHANPWSAQISTAPKSFTSGLSEPKDVHGIRGAVRFLPERWDMKDIQFFLESNVTYYESHCHQQSDSIFITALAPVLRMSFFNHTSILPYIEMSIGGAWISKQQFANRHLGRSFLFQDMAGAGIRFGKNQQLFAAIHIIHYSNAGIFKENMGITVPVLLSIGGLFG